MEAKRFRPGMRLLHLRSGRPVEVIEVGERTFTVATLDDRWIDPRDGKEKGGCAWVLFLEDAEEFVLLEEGLT